MFGNYQSSNQANIANNNIDSKVSNSTTNLTFSSLTTVSTTALDNVGTIDGNMVLSKNCIVSQDNHAKTESSQNLSSIATTNTTFDNTLSTNVTNDLKADLEQSTPGLSGGYLSAQMNNQVNSVSNDVQNSIRNASYISRSNAITSLKKDTARNTWHVGGDFTCSDKASFRQGNTVSQVSLQGLKTRTNDAYTVKNDISTTLDNTLSTSASQGGSIAMYLTIAVVVWSYFSQKPSNGRNGFDVWVTFAKIAVILSLIHWELIQYIHGRDPTDSSWYAYWNKSYMWTKQVPTSWIPDWVAKNSFGLFEIQSICMDGTLRGMGQATDDETEIWEKKCEKYYDKVSKWKDKWQDETIRNDISIPGEGGVLIEDRQYDCDISGGVCKTCDFPLVNGICQQDDLGNGPSAAQKDFRYEELLKISLGCSHLEGRKDSEATGTYIDFTTDMMSWHHEVYLWDGDPNGSSHGAKLDFKSYDNKKPILRHDPDKIENKERSAQIIQPGVGYLTGSGYKTECKRKKTGPELQAIVNSNAGKTDGAHDTEYEEWGSCCDTDDCTDSDITVSLRGDSSCSSNTAAINNSDLAGSGENGMGCWRKSGDLDKPNLNALLGDLALTVVSGDGETSGVPTPCVYNDFISSIGQLVAGTVMHCDDDDDKHSCTTADNCSANFLKKLVLEDNTNDPNTNVNMTDSDILSEDGLCPAPDTTGVAACGFSVGGVTHIVIDTVPSTHTLNPNNMYRIVSDIDGAGGKQIYRDPNHSADHKVTWASSLAEAPSDRTAVKGSLGIWSSSAAIQTSSFHDQGSDWVTATSGSTICKDGGGNHIHPEKTWPEMGNPCEATFRLNPLVTESTIHDTTRKGSCKETAMISVPENKIACNAVSNLHKTSAECDAVTNSGGNNICTYTKPGTIITSGSTVTMGCGGQSLEDDHLTRCQCEPRKEEGGAITPTPINIIEVFSPFAGSGWDFWFGLMYLFGPPVILASVFVILVTTLQRTSIRTGAGLRPTIIPPVASV